ncbi:SOH1-domain-containing protein [Circinella umbellata]|nr:SOH1-domain-containing protein [Circinella umbellata]
MTPSPPPPQQQQQPNEKDEQERFQMELEFIQCLSNPWYINHLAQQQYFKDEAFINYLEYLQYWKKPEYAKFVVYPHALHFLDLLQHAQFRDYITTSDHTQEVHRMQYYHWMYLRNSVPSKDQQPQQQQGQTPPQQQSQLLQTPAQQT